jgi:hypothetical protein
MASATRSFLGPLCRLAATGSLLALLLGPLITGAAQPKFYDDDPLEREPDSQNAVGVQEWDIDLVIDLTTNLFGHPGDPAPNVKAQNVNTVDEVPDSSWFTNRIGARDVSIDEALKGPVETKGPAPGPWTVARPKQSGFAPGFTMKDSAGETWFVSFDARGFPEAATGAIMVANKIFWTLGYYQVENHLIRVVPEQLHVADSAKVRTPSGRRRPMKASDLDQVFKRAHRAADGSYRAVAGRAIPGRVLGGFRYHGTRPDDPNDIVPHEHRRELRALKVFGAWTNLVDMKAGNTLDTLVTVNGRSAVRHYLQDVGSTFGAGALGPHDYDEGWEHLYEGGPLLKRMLTLGLALPQWATIAYQEHPSIGRFEGKVFDPTTWKPRVPTAAFARARADDDFWAARRVTAFSDAMIHALVRAGRFSDPAAERLLADVLIQRRNKITDAFLPAVNPIVGVSLSTSGWLTFENAAVAAGVAKPPTRYEVRWARFDNATGESVEVGEPASADGTRAQAPSALPQSVGTYVKAQVRAVGGPAAWSTPVDLYFRRTSDGWRLVGLERLP